MYGLPDIGVCIQADLSRCAKCKVLRAVESPLRGYNDLLGGFEELDCIVPQGRQRNGGLSRVRISGVSMPPCTLQSITFLSQTPDQPGQLSVTVIWCLDKPHT
jgi:hypothetical protein